LKVNAPGPVQAGSLSRTLAHSVALTPGGDIGGAARSCCGRAAERPATAAGSAAAGAGTMHKKPRGT
jgi:hypothetical protein